VPNFGSSGTVFYFNVGGTHFRVWAGTHPDTWLRGSLTLYRRDWSRSTAVSSFQIRRLFSNTIFDIVQPEIQGDSKIWTEFRMSIFPELYMVCE